MTNLRIGFGYDVHQFAPDRRLVLGGVEIPSPMGLAGHSDADVLLHAICDALLGAAALGDIGHHFPDTDPNFKDVSSLILLKETCRLLDEAGFAIGNIDATVVLEAPKIAPHVLKMKNAISGETGLPPDRISIKATTSETLGFVGKGEGCVAFATTLLEKKTP